MIFPTGEFLQNDISFRVTGIPKYGIIHDVGKDVMLALA
jgi:hypothetical protein